MDDEPLEDDVESGSGGWTHGVAWGSYNDNWHISSQRNHTPDGISSWKCGSQGSGPYSNMLNAALSITVNMHDDARVSFWQRMNAEEGWDGGLVERAVGGGWEQIYPIGGYPDHG